MYKITFILLIGISSLFGTSKFLINGNTINPACIKILQTSLAESSEIIIHSLVLESCQDSNLASVGMNSYKKGETSFCSDPDDGHTCFSYKVLGTTKNNIFYLFHSGYIGAYTIKKQPIYNLETNKSLTVHILTKVGSSFIPCFQSARIDKNKLLITKKIFDAYQPTAFQCQTKLEELTFEIINP